MKALAWHGKRVRIDPVPDPQIIDPTDVIVRVTSSGICGSGLHLYEVLRAFLDKGMCSAEPIGVVEEVGRETSRASVTERTNRMTPRRRSGRGARSCEG